MTLPMAPLIVVAGETASGKSALALQLARQFDGELVCADSWTVYKGFDIGSAKPTAAERAAVPHHLVDVADPHQGFSAVEFKKRAQQAIDDITARGKLPIMVGGTGLYIDSVLYDYVFLPEPPASQRAELAALPLETLLERAKADGLDLSAVDTRNKRRVIRLIESRGAVPGRGSFRPNTLLLAIATDREHLAQRVEQRVDAMLAAGLEREVAGLAAKYGWQTEAMKGIGYREWQAYFVPGLLGEGNPEATQSLVQTRQRIIRATMQLAKRQRTWFRNGRYHDCIHWLTPPNTQQQAVDYVTTFLGT